MSEIIQYSSAVQAIKTAILQGQYEAAKGVNRVQLAVYFCIGKYVSLNSRKGKWGTGALQAISNQLRRELPGLRGYSAESLKKMRLFYEAWSMLDANPQKATDTAVYADSSIENAGHEGVDNSVLASTELDRANSVIVNTELQDPAYQMNIYNAFAIPNIVNFPIEAFLPVPFTHHRIILTSAKDLNERLYYIHRCAEEHLSVERLEKLIKVDDAYHHQDVIPNNFGRTLSVAALARKAVMAFKDEYMLDFINVEEIGERDAQDVDERVVEQQIVHNVKRFVMTMGRDFAFIGNQQLLEVYGVEHFPDLLFFNRELNAMVVIELKTGSFKPAYLGQLTTYLRILDDKMKKPHENPSIGIVLCKDANRHYVEYVIQDYDKPMGVATYKTLADMPEQMRRTLPDDEEMRKLLDVEK